jgi:hypothetical protein
MSRQGDLALLGETVAQTLLTSTQPAHLAYVATNGTPRVVPVWFHWTGAALVVGSPPTSPKIQALSPSAPVAVSIDTAAWPYRVLQIRGRAHVDTVTGVAPEYALAAERYFGAEQGKAWVRQIATMFPAMARITVRPEWVALLDFETRFPGAIEAASAQGS